MVPRAEPVLLGPIKWKSSVKYLWERLALKVGAVTHPDAAWSVDARGIDTTTSRHPPRATTHHPPVNHHRQSQEPVNQHAECDRSRACAERQKACTNVSYEQALHYFTS
ncbi:hypothetical protein J6590_080135 [Homalodisca vitripennis]|nr:hypothetical protein J6590_080135 [Homalodisca vitripennis]